LKKNNIFSLLTNPTRRIIIYRLLEAEKAGYSDLLDSVDHIHSLQSTGNFNYHLNFLIQNEIICKNGSVYRLTDKGKEIARFVIEVDQKWISLEKYIRGENLSVFNLAELFEEETGIKMEKEITNFLNSEMVMDEKKIIGVLVAIDEQKFNSQYELLATEKMSMTNLALNQESGNSKTYAVLSHPDIDYYISPKYFGLIQDFLERNFGQPHIYAITDKPSPFIMKVENKKEKCFFVIAPSFFGKDQLKKIPKKE